MVFSIRFWDRNNYDDWGATGGPLGPGHSEQGAREGEMKSGVYSIVTRNVTQESISQVNFFNSQEFKFPHIKNEL